LRSLDLRLIGVAIEEQHLQAVQRLAFQQLVKQPLASADSLPLSDNRSL
jgi:hypothetical protein